ncbi:amidohydrolase [Mycobacterium sp. 21AC1]|uniref:amidohydrolase family protein n=1 Tax=[Mycobacterium] appelbergii TaxID=2939269 RepID=UPI0029390820|nr:amidohydrolase family protein [Mycobacterium sp. 21AC1]MDV3126041.1 amidohydrolase [Mycobacterium sp. 21AC1]
MSAARIDAHHHVVPPRYRRWLQERGVSAGGRAIPEWSAENSLGLMDRIGVESAILSVSTPGVEPADADNQRPLARELNEFCAITVQEVPQRFGFWATLTLPDVEGALLEATYALDELHADGVVILANSQGTYLGDRRFDPLMEELNRRAAVVFVHPSHLPGDEAPGIPAFAADFLLDTTRAAVNMVINGTLERYPDLRVILSHAGGFVPYAADRIARSIALEHSHLTEDAVLTGLRQFYFDTALSGSKFALPSLLSFAEPDHIVFGSDYPYAPAEWAMSFTDNLDNYVGLDHALVNRGNAERLLPRLAR